MPRVWILCAACASMVEVVLARRLGAGELQNTTSAKGAGTAQGNVFPCEIKWNGKSNVAMTATFGVDSCQKCHFAANSYMSRFGAAFTYDVLGDYRKCECKVNGEFRVTISKCRKTDEEHVVKQECFSQYMVDVTTSWVGGAKLTAKRQPKLWQSDTFSYRCERDALPSLPDTWVLPKVSDTRDEQEKALIGEKVYAQEKEGRRLSGDAKQLVEGLSTEETDEDMFAFLFGGRPVVTLDELNAKYTPDEGVDMAYITRAADLINGAQKVDVAAFKRVRKIERLAKGRVVPEAIITGMLFAELSHGGEPVDYELLEQEYIHRMEDSGADVGAALESAGLASSREPVTQPNFAKFRKALNPPNEEALLFAALCKPGQSTVDINDLIQEFEDGSSPAIDVARILSDAGLAPGTTNLDLEGFTGVLKALKKMRKARQASEPPAEEAALFSELSTAGDGTVDVAALMERLGDAAGPPINVVQILADAGLPPGTQKLDPAGFTSVVRAVRKSSNARQTPDLSSEEAALFSELNEDGTVDVAALMERLGGAAGPPSNVVQILADAGLPPGTQKLDPAGFTSVVRAVRQSREFSQDPPIQELLPTVTVAAPALDDSEEEDDELVEELLISVIGRTHIVANGSGTRRPQCPETTINYEHRAGADHASGIAGAGLYLKYFMPQGSEDRTFFCRDSSPPAEGVTEGTITFSCGSDFMWFMKEDSCVWPQDVLRQIEASAHGPGACQRTKLSFLGEEHSLPAASQGSPERRPCGKVEGEVVFQCSEGVWALDQEETTCSWCPKKVFSIDFDGVTLRADLEESIQSGERKEVPCDSVKVEAGKTLTGIIVFECIANEDGKHEWTENEDDFSCNFED